MSPSDRIRPSTELDDADRARLFAWLDALVPGRHASAAAMAEGWASTIFEHGRTHLSLWRDGAPAGVAGVVVREIAPKGLAYVLGATVAPGDDAAFAALLGGVGTTFPVEAWPTVMLGTYPDAPWMADLLPARGFAGAHDLLELTYLPPDLPAAPPGLRCEALTAATEAAYRATSNAAFQDSPGGATLTPDDVATMRAERPHPELLGLGWAGDEPVAAYCLQLQDGEGWIEALAVAPAGQGRGYGRALLAHAIATLRAHGATAVKLQVASTNEPAVGLYRRAGFGAEREVMRWHRR